MSGADIDLDECEKRLVRFEKSATPVQSTDEGEKFAQATMFLVGDARRLIARVRAAEAKLKQLQATLERERAEVQAAYHMI